MPALPAIKELGPKHICLDQADENVAKIAKSLPWYGPKYSPHDVPSFYDVSGITENPEVFQMVVDFFVERYRSQGAEGPTHIAGFDARGFLFGPPIALALKIPFVMIRKAGKLPGRTSCSSTSYSRPLSYPSGVFYSRNHLKSRKHALMPPSVTRAVLNV